MLLPCIERGAVGGCSGTVIWLHGLGASGHDFEPMVPMLGLPDVRFIFPHAPEMPVTLNMGFVMPSWYDIRSLDHRDPERENPDHVRRSATWIEALIRRELERGVPASRIVIAGFSQGGAVALHVAHRYPSTLAGIMALSTYLVLAASFDEEAHPSNGETPVLMCHGTHDDVVPMAGGKHAHDRFVQPGRDVRWHEFSMGHEVCAEEIGVIRDWLHERLG